MNLSLQKSLYHDEKVLETEVTMKGEIDFFLGRLKVKCLLCETRAEEKHGTFFLWYPQLPSTKHYGNKDLWNHM